MRILFPVDENGNYFTRKMNILRKNLAHIFYKRRWNDSGGVGKVKYGSRDHVVEIEQ